MMRSETLKSPLQGPYDRNNASLALNHMALGVSSLNSASRMRFYVASATPAC